MTYNLVQKTHYIQPAPSAYPGMWEVYSLNSPAQGGPPEFKGRYPDQASATARMQSLNASSAGNFNSKDSFDAA
jgi:hypothetical protein